MGSSLDPYKWFMNSINVESVNKNTVNDYSLRFSYLPKNLRVYKQLTRNSSKP